MNSYFMNVLVSNLAQVLLIHTKTLSYRNFWKKNCPILQMHTFLCDVNEYLTFITSK